MSTALPPLARTKEVKPDLRMTPTSDAVETMGLEPTTPALQMGLGARAALHLLAVTPEMLAGVAHEDSG